MKTELPQVVYTQIKTLLKEKIYNTMLTLWQKYETPLTQTTMYSRLLNFCDNVQGPEIF